MLPAIHPSQVAMIGGMMDEIIALSECEVLEGLACFSIYSHRSNAMISF